MNNRELYTALINTLKGEETSATPDELVSALEALILKMDAANEKRRIKTASKNDEKAPIREALVAALQEADSPLTASELISRTELDIKTGSIPSLMKPLVESGIVLKTEVKDTDSKTKHKAYILA